MGRPLKQRLLSSTPVSDYFQPQGVPLHRLGEVALERDEFEALRLADLDGLRHSDVATRMGVSRQTVGNTLERARYKIADALLNGKALRIGAAARPTLEEKQETS